MPLDDERGESPSATPIADDYPEGAVAPSKRLCRPKAIPDSVYPGMWRVRWPDGCVSDLANLTRVSDAIAVLWKRRSGASANPESRGAHGMSG